MTLKITHIIDDEKFPDAAHYAFEATFPKQNEFIVFSNRKKLRFIKRISPKFYSPIYLHFKCLIRKITHADIVVFHGMDRNKLRILKALPENTKTIWLGWGFDYYDLISKPLLKEKTNTAIGKINSSKKALLKTLLKKAIQPELRKVEILNKITVFSPVLYEDYELVKKAIPGFLPTYASWNYGTLEDDLIRGFEGKKIVGKNILLGNSASHTNNHLDAFDNLSASDISGRKIITPLSYGDTRYRDLIASEGNKVFGDAFVPLIDFMPIDDYIAILQSCSIVIMNHLRQQALGNIVIGLYLGAKVFLDKENPIYQFFVNNNAHIYSIEDLAVEIHSELTDDQINSNRQILQEHWGREVIHHKTKQLIDASLKTSST